MKGLYFSSRSLSMSLPNRLVDEKHKSKHREDISKLSSRFKFKRDKITKNSESKKDTSTFEKCKKLVSFKRYSAQDRLTRLRANLQLQTKIIDQVCSEAVASSCDESRKSEILHERFLLASNDTLKKTEPDSLPKVKYSADSRLKKIKAAFLKKISSKRLPDLKSDESVADIQTDKTTCPVSSSEVGLMTKLSNEIPKLERVNSGNDTCMDLDLDCTGSGQIKKVAGSVNYSNTNAEKNSSSSPPRNSLMADEICKFRKERAYLALHESFTPNLNKNFAVPVGDVFIILDTNIFLSHLRFVRKLLTRDIPPYKRPVIVIPWLVLQELDYANKKKSIELASRANAANVFIYECLKEKNTRLFGQSLEDFKQTFKNAVSVDDYILQYCLKFVSLKNNVILVTDDINLCSKSMVNGLSVFTQREFERKFALSEE